MVSRNKRSLQLGAMPVTREQLQEIRTAKDVLKRKGWTWRAAARQLDYSYTHFAWVLTGRRYSKSFMREINALPVKEAA